MSLDLKGKVFIYHHCRNPLYSGSFEIFWCEWHHSFTSLSLSRASVFGVVSYLVGRVFTAVQVSCPGCTTQGMLSASVISHFVHLRYFRETRKGPGDKAGHIMLTQCIPDKWFSNREGNLQSKRGEWMSWQRWDHCALTSAKPTLIVPEFLPFFSFALLTAEMQTITSKENQYRLSERTKGCCNSNRLR